MSNFGLVSLSPFMFQLFHNPPNREREKEGEEGGVERERDGEEEGERESCHRERCQCAPQREQGWILHPQGSYLKSQGRISVEYSSRFLLIGQRWGREL